MTTNLQQVASLLFVSGDEGVSVGQLAELTGFMKPAIHEMVAVLKKSYDADQDCPFTVLESADVYRLATKAEVEPVVKKYFESPLSTNLSRASLEVLAIIAYKQPITRIEIDDIRGVQSSSTIQKLVLRQMIEDTGRADEPGRPIIYKTTAEFLNYFGLKTIKELPPLKDEEADDESQSETLINLFNKQWEAGDK